MPPLATLTTDPFDDSHVAWVVTSCVVPFDRAAVAVSCVFWPIVGAVPVIAIVLTVGLVGDRDVVGAVGGFPPHPADNVAAIKTAQAVRYTMR